MLNTAILPASWSGPLQSILRIMLGLLFLAHGTTKMLGFPVSQYTPAAGAMETMTMVTGTLELAGGVLIVLGLFTRITAFILAGFMAVAYFWAHAPMGFHPINNYGELAIMFCFVFLYLAAAGPGTWSIDAKRR